MAVRIIALMNQKGGVGKTTTTVNLGAALAEAGKRVCLIDLDPQAHLTINFGVDPSPDVCSLYNILVEDKSFLEAVFKVDDRTALVPSSIDLAAAEVELVSVLGRETLLKRRMEAAGVAGQFDFILLDCPPSLGILMTNALAAADEILTPIQCEFFALEGLVKIVRVIDQIRGSGANDEVEIAAIVMTMFDARTNLSGQVVAEVREHFGDRVYSTVIPRTVRLSEAPSFGKSIFEYDANGVGARAYRALAEEFMQRQSLITTAGSPSATDMSRR